MIRIISLLLVVSGIYIGMQYKEPILELLGQDSLDHVEDVLKNGKEAIIDKLEQVQG